MFPTLRGKKPGQRRCSGQRAETLCLKEKNKIRFIWNKKEEDKDVWLVGVVNIIMRDKNVVATGWSNSQHNHQSFLSKLKRLHFGGPGRKYLSPTKIFPLFFPNQTTQNTIFSSPFSILPVFHPTKCTLGPNRNITHCQWV